MSQALEPQSRVRVIGIAEDQEIEFNGRAGILTSWHERMGRWLVRLDGDRRQKLFKEENLLSLATTQPPVTSKLEAMGPGAPLADTCDGEDSGRMSCAPPQAGLAPEAALEQEAEKKTLRSRGYVTEQQDDAATSVNDYGRSPVATVGAGRLKAHAPAQAVVGTWQKSIDARLASLEQQLADQLLHIEAAKQTTLETDKRLSVAEEAISNMLTTSYTQRIQDLEEANIEVLRSLEDMATFPESDKLAAAQEELEQQLCTLYDCLADSGVLSSWAYHSRLQRKKFANICTSSGWHGTASLLDALRDAGALAMVSAFCSPMELLPVRAASGECVKLDRILTAAAHRTLETICDSITETDGDTQAMRRAIKLANATGDSEHLKTANFIQRALANSELNVVLGSGKTGDELQLAIEQAELVGINVTKARQRINELETLRSSARRKLRAACAWANKDNMAKLREAVKEAEAFGVDPKEVSKAKATMESLEPEQANHISNFLATARPSWNASTLQQVESRLAKIGISTIEDLRASLEAEGDNHLTQRLKAANLKTFLTESLIALMEELEHRRAAAVTDRAELRRAS